jgi:hypothetical protein
MTVIDAHAIAERDEHATGLLDAMDAAGIDVTVIAPADDETAVRNRTGNERLLGLAAERPERIRAYAVANPWFGADAVAELDRALDAGAVGLKINSALQGFLLLDPIVDPLIEVVQAHGAFVYAHTGTPIQALPLQLAELASRFPGVPFVMGRSGRTDFRGDAPTALDLADNLYADTSHDYGVTGLTNIFAAFGAARMVFCSDHPYAMRSDGLRAVRGVEASDADRDRILCRNAADLLGLAAHDAEEVAHVR